MRIDYVFVHIWEDNANLYATYEAALAGITEEHNDVQRAVVAAALTDAQDHPGEAAYIDAGLMDVTVRYLSVTS